MVFIALLLVVPASDLALSALNLDVTFLLKPNTPPKMDTSKGIPESARTFVVVPTIFSSEEAVRQLLENMEVHCLANRDENIYFALLGDFADAPEETMPEDDQLLDVAIKGVEDLNARYSDSSPDRFYLFHRCRRWNPTEGKWMGWERKRGKLQEFNRLLRGARDTNYIVAAADTAFLAKVRYVITLDSDTQLPRDSARRLIGTALHPLNGPRLDPQTKRVTEGTRSFSRASAWLLRVLRDHTSRAYSRDTPALTRTRPQSRIYTRIF